MTAKNPPVPRWLADVDVQDYVAGRSYLNLIYTGARADKLVAKLKNAKLKEFKAKDIFRASRLSLLGISNSHVERDNKKIMKGKALSPLLLVRESTAATVVIADGYHRLCAVYALDEDAVVPCKIA